MFVTPTSILRAPQCPFMDTHRVVNPSRCRMHTFPAVKHDDALSSFPLSHRDEPEGGGSRGQEALALRQLTV